MTIRNHITLAAILATLTACQHAPAHADAFPDNLPIDPARPGWRPAAGRPYVPMAGHHYDFDPDAGPQDLDDLQDDLWLVTPGAWGAATGPVSLPPPPVVAPPGCRPAPAAVPGPAGLLGVGAMLHASRQLRRRIIR